MDGWEDPRLITLAGLRRRGATPEAIQAFCRGVGITRRYRLNRLFYFPNANSFNNWDLFWLWPLVLDGWDPCFLWSGLLGFV